MQTISNYVKEYRQILDVLPDKEIRQFVAVLDKARLSGRQVFIMGNGGSAATASHFVCDIAKNTRKPGLPHFRVIGLTDNFPIASAYANDEGYETIFANQLANLIQPNDVVIAISVSGNSPNVLKGIELATKSHAITVGMTGYDGGLLGSMVNLHIHIPSFHMELVEDVHMMIAHMSANALRNLTHKLTIEDGAQAIKVDEVVEKSLADQLFSPVVGADGQTTEDPRKLLANLSEQLSQQVNLHDLLTRALQITLHLVRASSGTIIVLDEAGDVIDGALALWDQTINHPIQRLIETYQDGLAGWVVKNRQPVLVENTREDPRWLHRDWEYAEDGSRSAVSVPLMTQDRVVGVLTLVHPEPGGFQLEDVALLTAVTMTISYSFATRGILPAEETSG